MCVGAVLAGERQEMKAWLLDPHRYRGRLDGHFGDPSLVKDVGIFAVVVIIPAVFGNRQFCGGKVGEGDKGKQST